ncbi:hypothetical protein BC835DRAFT_1423249 [Cytidiella melzeri]|nr:hypothetical protein BC835DRAFT_1423249 [Cytidiella melzeri]
MPNEEAITLVFNATLKVAGEAIHGEVHLDFPSLMRDKIEEVHVKLRGSVYTQITRQVGQNTSTRSHRIWLAHENVSLWRQGNGVYPPSGNNTLKLPFTFTLPSELIPSCEFNVYRKRGSVRYFIQVVGQRPGIWRFNERHLTPFMLLPPLPAGAELREAIRRGWQGPWTTITEEKDIRRGIWGERSHVKTILVIPELSILPVLTPIPFTLTVVTHSKSMKPEDKSAGETIFPTPPSKPEQLNFRIERYVFIRARGWTAAGEDDFAVPLGGGDARTPLQAPVYDPVGVLTTDKVWIPTEGDEKHEKGRWKQEVVFKSYFRLNCPPAFHSETMQVRYNLSLKVDFPGIGNSLKTVFPVRIVSSMYPPGQRAWDGPPPEIDIPPAYFQAANWDADEKE